MVSVSALGLRISAVFQRVVPDPFVIAILLTVFTAALCVALGRFEDVESGFLNRAIAVLDAWRFVEKDPEGSPIPAGQLAGVWRLLEFTMQMCLILVTGYAVASTRVVRAMIDRVARVPRTPAQAAALVAALACTAGLVNWGLGLIVGALLARDVGRALEDRGARAHYPLLCAAGYMGLLVWHGGLSGSAPLAMTSRSAAEKVIPPQYLAQVGEGGVPLTETILSPQNLLITGGMLVIVPLLCAMLHPRGQEHRAPISDFSATVDDRAERTRRAAVTLPDRLDHSRVVAWLLALPLFLALVRWGTFEGGWSAIGLNQVNVFMLALGLVLHGSPVSYMKAAADGARACAGIIIQFPLYAGIIAMMDKSGLVRAIAELFNEIGGERSMPFLSFVSASIVNLFVPSGGGQWSIQGPIALETGMGAGVPPGRMIMSVAYGDQLTNMLQPFWALPLLGITGVKARDIVGYTALIMLAAGAWITLGLFIL